MTQFDDPGLTAIPRQTAEAAAALEALREPARRAADSIDEAFTRAGSSLSRSLARAASDGKVSLAELAQAVLAAVNAAAGARGGGLAEAVSAVLKGGFAGARADGGLTVNVTVQGGGPEGLVRSEAQVAQALARAVSLGARRL